MRTFQYHDQNGDLKTADYFSISHLGVVMIATEKTRVLIPWHKVDSVTYVHHNDNGSRTVSANYIEDNKY